MMHTWALLPMLQSAKHRADEATRPGERPVQHKCRSDHVFPVCCDLASVKVHRLVPKLKHALLAPPLQALMPLAELVVGTDPAAT